MRLAVNQEDVGSTPTAPADGHCFPSFLGFACPSPFTGSLEARQPAVNRSGESRTQVRFLPCEP